MAVDKSKNTQVLVTFPNEMLEEIEQYWRKDGCKNRNEGIRKLIKRGLADTRKRQSL